jgi:hypothetical protein
LKTATVAIFKTTKNHLLNRNNQPINHFCYGTYFGFLKNGQFLQPSWTSFVENRENQAVFITASSGKDSAQTLHPQFHLVSISSILIGCMGLI